MSIFERTVLRFIALFCKLVINGEAMMPEWKELKKDTEERIKEEVT